MYKQACSISDAEEIKVMLRGREGDERRWIVRRRNMMRYDSRELSFTATPSRLTKLRLNERKVGTVTGVAVRWELGTRISN